MTFNLMFLNSRENTEDFPIEYILLTPGDGTAARPEAAWPLAYLLLSPGPGLDWAGWAARASGAVM